MPTAISAGVSRKRGVTAIAARNPALMNPVCSATPRPSIATSTTPSGGKLVKVETMVAMKAVSDSPASMLRISMGLPLRGSISAKLTCDSSALTTHATTMSSRNSTAGSGSRLPTRSTTSRLRESQPRRSREVAAGPVGEGVFVMVGSSVGFGSWRPDVPGHQQSGGEHDRAAR